MAVLEVKTIVETEASDKKIDGLVDSMEQLGKVQKESLAAQKKAGAEASKASTDGTKGTKLLSKGFKGVGMAIKGAGIGLLVGTIGLLVQAFKGNQKVMDIFASVMDTIAIVGNQVATVIGDVVTKVSEGTGGFEKLQKTVSGLITIALTPLKLLFFGITLAVQEAQLAFEDSVFGDGDKDKIKELNTKIIETQGNLMEVASGAVDAGKSVVDNFAGAVGEIGKVTEGIVEGVKDISIEAALETAKANKELEKSAEIAEAKLTGLIEKYDLQAERQRQIRDDETNNIADRIKANEELGRILQEQQIEQTKQAQKGLDAARAKLSIDKENQEALVAEQQALNELAAVAAQVAGFESEQQTNRNSLLREQKEIIGELSLLGKSEQERLILEAEQERTLRLEQTDLFIEDEILKKERIEAIEQEHKNTLAEITKTATDKADDAKTKADNKIKADDEAIAAIKVGLVSSGFAILQQLAGGNAKRQKGIAAAQATFDTFAAIVGQLKSTARTPAGGIPGFAIAQAVATGVFGLLQVKKILSTDATGGTSAPSISGGSGGGGGGGGARPSQSNARIPDFGAFNQGVGGGSGLPSNRAVVVNQDIRDSNAMDNRVNDLIRLGK